MSRLRSCRTLLVPTLLAVAGSLTLGATLPSQALETAQVAENAGPEALEPAGVDGAAPDEATTDTAVKQAVPLILERPNEDLLLPGRVNGRALNPQEQNRLRLGLERLNLEANVAHVQGDRPGAYRKFFRILSLSQYLPVPEELSYLTRVGRRAWQDSLGEEAQVITARVRQLEADAGEKLSPARRLSLAEAYESLGAWEPAIAHYETLLAMEQPNGEKGANRGSESSVVVAPTGSGTSPLTETTLVNRLARLSLFSLDYSSAALYTEQALILSQAADNASTEASASTASASPIVSDSSGTVPDADLPAADVLTPALPLPSETAPAQTTTGLLTQLAYVYEQDRRFAEAAVVQQQIFPLYDDPLLVSQQPALRVAIAHNQARSGQLVEAIASYQAAYGQAQTLQQFDVSNEALSQLAELYRNQNQLNDALAVYDVLLQVHDLSYNLYGIADTQASRAEIFAEQQQIDQASQAYRQAIYAAKLLGYREAELQQRLDDLPMP